MVLESLLRSKDIMMQKIPEAFCAIGYENKGLSWEIDIDLDGNIEGPFLPCGNLAGKRYDEKTKSIPLPWNKRTSGTEPRILADKAEYVLKMVDGKKPNQKRTENRHAAFIELTRECLEDTGSEDVRAVLRFLESGSWDEELADAIEKGMTSEDIVTFRVDDDPRLVIESEDVKGFWASRSIECNDTGICLLCGREGNICRIHPIKILGVPGPSGGGDIVSFNKTSSWAYGKEQSLNAPTCPRCAMDYARILNALLASKDHCVKFSDSAIVMWGEEEDNNPWAMDIKNPSAGSSSAIASMIQSPWRGKPVPGEIDEMFNIIDLMRGDRQARIAIRSHRRERLHVIRERVARFFEASRICDHQGDIGEKFHGLLEFGIACCKDGGSGTMSKQIEGVFEGRFMSDWFSAIVMGHAIPSRRLTSALLTRILAGDRFDRKRAALARLLTNQKGDVMPVALDEKVIDPAYLLGRFFCMVEFMQDERGDVNSTIARQYLNEMMMHPQRAFTKMVEMSEKYLGQMSGRKEGAKVMYEKALRDITDNLSITDIPRGMTDEQKMTFLLGRYHQSAEIWRGRMEKKRLRELDTTAPDGETES